jgi:hypothetical protein
MSLYATLYQQKPLQLIYCHNIPEKNENFDFIKNISIIKNPAL